MRITIAIDGPAGAGKSTIAKLIADKLNIMYINTGLMYRAVTYKALKNHISPDNVEDLCSMIDNMSMYFDRNDLIVDEENMTSFLNTNEINRNVSSFASIPEVRTRLVNSQREMAKKYDVIMDGRDIGTVVLKNAAFKFFLTATPEERAERRFKELSSKGVVTTFDEVLKDIIDRDYTDTTREIDPLVKADDAVQIDTTGHSIPDIVETILQYINKEMAKIDEGNNSRQVILAQNAGFCFGVKRAVDTAIETKNKYSTNIYTLGPLIHNNDVVNYLRDKNIVPIELHDINLVQKGDIVIIRSHGVSPDTIDLIKSREATVIDATCPYVSHIQKKVKSFCDLGYAIVVVGDSKHPEVIGINGWCDNKAIISKDGSNLFDLPSKVCVVSQTTEKQENWQRVLSVLSKNCKEIIAFNTICSATEKRQKSAEEISKISDVMIVIGSKDSSNTTKLFEICSKYCSHTIFVENSSEIPDWILNNSNFKKVGITAGASTPDWIIKEVMNKMNDESQVEFNEQLAYMDQNDKQINVGKTIKGEVISIGKNEAYLNIGYKAEGLLPANELTFDENANLEEIINVGQVLEVKVISRRNEDGYVVLSRVEIERDKSIKYLQKAYEEKTPVSVIVREAVNGGVVATYNGARIFIPASHLELSHVANLADYVGKTFEVNIVEYDNSKRNLRIIASRRNMLKEYKSKKEEETWSKLEKDMVLEGEVKRITDFGAFVDILGVDGLLHISEISWGRVNKPSEILKVGDKVKVKIIDLDKENKKLSLSIKALSEDPWNNVEEKYPADNVVLGKVVRFANFGVFVELEPGVDGLVHISEISHKRIEKPSDALSVGQQVKAKILDVNKETKKIGLSIKAVE